jgi:hypothetical protein
VSSISAETARIVIERALDRCEYCRMHQALQGATFHIEHILPKSVGGNDAPENLALACPSCNLSKSARTVAKDPETGIPTVLYHPRRDEWTNHFSFRGYHVTALTATGRCTIDALQLNASRRLLIREAEEGFSLFPPEAG